MMNRKEKPDLSVIVPAYNISPYLDRCISSLKNQVSINLEIILVDDGSSDGTSEIIDRYSSSYEYIHAVHQENQGLYKARTNGIKYSTSDYITFCDGDDYIDKDFYKYALEKMMELDCDVLQFGYKRIENDEVIHTFSPTLKEMSGIEALQCMYETLEFAHSNCNKIYCASLLNEIDFSEDVKCDDEDVLIHTKILPGARKVCSIPEAGYNYIIRNGSIVDVGRTMKGINILKTDKIIYEYALSNYDRRTKKSAAYDYSAKLAYWYNKCYVYGEREKAKRINKLFRMIVKENNLFGFIPKHASHRRVMMINLLFLCPALCRFIFKITVKD